MMSLTTKGRYAARIMVYLARHNGSKPATKQEIGKAEDISANYVEQIMIMLKAARLVRSHRGRNGGFSLTRDAARITLAEVLRSVEGPVCPVPCLYGTCQREPSCPTRPVWKKAAEAVEEVLAETTIAQMAAQPADGSKASYQI
jgi:Rrf2 family protein